jgi:predicted dehydrogenase
VTVRIAILGTGNIARIHAEALREAGDDAELVAAADVDAARLAEFGRRHGVGATFGDLPRMLGEAKPDLVHICTPPWVHHEQALACLRAGASVLVEKPPTLSLREFDSLTEVTSPRGPWLATVFQHRFGVGHRRLRSMAADGVLGRPLVAVCNTTWFREQAYFDVPWRGRWDTEGGGPTMGHGIHQMDMFLDVLGDWASVTAMVRTQARRTQTEDVSLAMAEFTSGAVATVVNSLVSPREESYLRFDFERATVELTHLYGYGPQSWRFTPAPRQPDAVLAAWNRPAPHVSVRSPDADPERSGGDRGRSGHAAQFAEVLACLRAGRRPPVSPDGARRTLSLVAGIYASALRGGRTVTPADVAPGTPFYDRMSG